MNAIFSMDGSETPGVLRAAADAGFTGPIIGLGGTATELAALKAGKLYGTTCMSAGQNGEEAIAAIEAIVSGKPFEKTQAVVSPKVTKENADTCPGDW